MTPAEVDQAIDETLLHLPPDVVAAVENVQIFIAESRADLKVLRDAVTASGQQKVEIPRDFRAVFLGSPLDPAADGEDQDPQLAEGVFLFNAAMLRDGADVVYTLMHEIGHALGLDEDEVAALGLE